MVGLTALMTTVSVHAAELPAWSVASQMICRPLQSQLVEMETVPSAF